MCKTDPTMKLAQLSIRSHLLLLSVSAANDNKDDDFQMFQLQIMIKMMIFKEFKKT